MSLFIYALLNRNAQWNLLIFCNGKRNSGRKSYLNLSIMQRRYYNRYVKATFISLFTNFDSFIPILHKEALISTLLFRYFNISSSHAIFNDEVKKLA